MSMQLARKGEMIGWAQKSVPGADGANLVSIDSTKISAPFSSIVEKE